MLILNGIERQVVNVIGHDSTVYLVLILNGIERYKISTFAFSLTLKLILNEIESFTVLSVTPNA